jgi:CCR4-NOT transcriptional regulation complex NOT5 subunit
MSSNLKYNQNSGNQDFKKQFGLKRLEEKINNSPTEYSIIKNGIDLTTLGLNLNSNKDLIDSFGSPYENESDTKMPYQVTLPRIYGKASQQQISGDKIKILQPKTLIYLFYNFIEDKDVQMYAVRLLYDNKWVYNYKRMLWFHELEFRNLMHSKTLNQL